MQLSKSDEQRIDKEVDSYVGCQAEFNKWLYGLTTNELQHLRGMMEEFGADECLRGLERTKGFAEWLLSNCTSSTDNLFWVYHRERSCTIPELITLYLNQLKK